MTNRVVLLLLLTLLFNAEPALGQQTALRDQALATMKRAARYFHDNLAVQGGYVYHTSLDLKQRWGEGRAAPTQIWIQPPGTPTVGLAFLEAYKATGDRAYLDAATDAALAVCYGQLHSGGWTNSVDFEPRNPRTAAYRNGQGRGKNNSSLDDGQTQSALRLLMHVDQAYDFKHEEIHEAATFALDALLQAQFANGGFPQVWTGPVEERPILPASFPDYDWRTEGRIKNYWDMYTLNDNVCGYVAETLIDAHTIYGEERYAQALRKLGDFLNLAQLPEPQPGWAQQYNEQMKPIWARKFEPAAVAGDETQEAIATLLRIAAATGNKKYIEPIPAAIEYLQRSLLPDGQVARFYELQTNRPLYMHRRGDVYTLTYDDSNLPSHYGWKQTSRIESLQRAYEQAINDADLDTQPSSRVARQLAPSNVEEIRRIISDLDDQGRWVSTYKGESLVGQPKFALGARYLSSEVFARNLTRLSEFVSAADAGAR